MNCLVLIVPLLALVASISAFSAEDVINKEWELFKKENRKIYSEMEEIFRKKVFVENKHKIAAHNLRYQRGVHSYKLRMNEFGDLMHHEFVRIMNGLKRDYRNSSASGIGIEFMRPNFFKAPDSVDWREHGYVTPIKNQGHCGSCWSFSATGSLEGQHFRKTGHLASLSEQNLVDCSGAYGNNGCNGGLMDQAFQYIKDNHGIDTEEFYPYEAEDGTCKYSMRGRGATDKGFVDVLPQGDEEQLRHAVASVGPISVAIDASHQSFQFYSEGVYNEEDCSTEDLDHGVLVVGYGTEGDKDYWIVKNSWGPTWGEDGYVKMTRNKDNQCGIASQASYPIV